MLNANHWLRSIESYSFYGSDRWLALTVLEATRARKVSKTPTRLFFKAGLFIIYVKGNIKVTAKLRVSRLIRFEGTKRITSPEMRSKSFGTFDRRSGQFLESPEKPLANRNPLVLKK